jgi:catechol 2,3-dioxygenase-like lactoylglutathione lyase family enzyme
MSIELNHTIVPVSDRQRAATFFANLVGAPPGKPSGPFVGVSVNEHLTLDFDDRRGAAPGHYAFLVDDLTFDHVLSAADRLSADFGSGPGAGWDRGINHLNNGRGVYVQDPDGHSYEFFTTVPA